MASYNDSIGNYFIGNVTFTGDDPVSDTTFSNMGTDLSSICTNSGLQRRNVATNGDFGGLTSINMLHFGANLDTIDDRILFVSGAYNSSLSTQDNRVYLFNDSGGTLTTTPNTSAGSTNLTNQLYRRRSLDLPGFTFTPQQPNWVNTGRSVYWAGVSDGNSLALVQFSLGNFLFIGDSWELKFWYGGMLLNPHASLSTNSRKYVTLVATSIFTNSGGTGELDFYRRGRAYLDNETFSNTSASYTFSCVNGTIPTKQWAKDFEVKNGSTVMGKARNLLIGSGSYPLLIPLRIIGTGGLEKWLPVCHYSDLNSTNYTILMRCYSTSV